ncbi:pentapeptide repeat-containing protein [Amycolatopsis vastitatis]|uniref:pentapeptide repeat-containing protein n=1 Tax=Amycolatopsis vastitatis TaxID=1905142 RepID=UPI00130472FE|nr:pentapeptide repeat-containing protein [Amycolatopsis vastitatis]
MVLLLLAVTAGGCVAAGVRLLLRGARTELTPRPFSWWWVGVALPLSVTVGSAVAALLWGDTRAEHRDAFDAGWKSAAAVLAILAALVTVERLRLGQREHYRLLAADEAREINELSAKASEQLGNDKAAVRIGGLTDLERLAQIHVDLRQTVVDRICAYLRGPYRPPPGSREARRYPWEVPIEDYSESQNKVESGEQLIDEQEIAARRLELDVRRTAQQILRRHLTPEDKDAFWSSISLDLRDASLVEFSLSNCQLAEGDFEGATFYRMAGFSGTAFENVADFDRATFTDEASFAEARFHTSAFFSGASFADTVSFRGARFDESLRFVYAEAASSIDFEDAQFKRPTGFLSTKFLGDARFKGAKFLDWVDFGDTFFRRRAVFSNASFVGPVNFEGVKFGARATFDGVLIGEGISFEDVVVTNVKGGHIWPPSWSLKDGELVHGASAD